MMGFGLLVPLLILAALAYALGWIPNQPFSRRESSTAQAETPPLDIAKSRYARGEITKEQYEELHRELAG